MEIDRNGLEVLERDECIRLLRTTPVGRVSVTSGALPTVLPVNYRVIDGRVVFRSAPGSKLDAAALNAVVAFEADAIDPEAQAGWSVVVVGVAHRVRDDEVDPVERSRITRWATRPGDRLVAISTEMVTGRRLLPLAQADAG
jgi:nitroimidazol reductase NimA-like FMN-containing flavoprotein (pyridoxamine 5'-phosphate oxidase superfamily)